MSTSVIKFIDHTSDERPHKRRKNRHACEACRKRKRRCPHDYNNIDSELLPPTESDSTVSTSLAVRPEPSYPLSKSASSVELPRTPNTSATWPNAHDSALRQNAATKQIPAAQSASDTTEWRSSHSSSHSETGEGPNFVGHLNPEGVFLAATRLGTSGADKCDDNLGFWLPRKLGRRADDGERPPSSREPDRPASTNVRITRTSSPPQTNKSVKILPEPQSFNALRVIYFQDIHPLFPILRPELIPEMTASSQLSPRETILMQSLCLAVATNNNARPFLRLQPKNRLLPPKLFASRLSQALVTGLETVSSIDRSTSVCAFAILSLFSQLSTDNHTSAEYCARAVSYIHTMQLHLDTAHVRKDDKIVTQLFLCVWALDRLNAAFHSRPILMHDRDIGRNMKASIAEQEGCFRAFLTVCGLLEQVTSLYRPTHESRASDDNFALAPFEDLVVRAGAVRCQAHLIATIETLYHSVAMLSHRFYSLEDPDRSSISYLRSSISAARIITIFGTEFGTNLSNFPFVPYAISLALRVSYRELRFSKTALHRAIARSQVLTICSFLEKFGDRFAFARRLAALAAKTIREMDRVAASVLQARQNEIESAPPLGSMKDQGAHPTTIDYTSDTNNNTENIQQEPLSINVAVEKFDYPHPSQIPQYDPEQYNAASFDIVHQIMGLPDLFEHFDPEFNLGAVDLALVQNLGAAALQSFDLSPDTDWMSSSEISNVLSNSAEPYTLLSATTS